MIIDPSDIFNALMNFADECEEEFDEWTAELRVEFLEFLLRSLSHGQQSEIIHEGFIQNLIALQYLKRLIEGGLPEIFASVREEHKENIAANLADQAGDEERLDG